jgi:hypothetical protein
MFSEAGAGILPTEYVWSPQPKQKVLIDCLYPFVLFGGARGGGKTNGFLGKFGLKAGYSKYTNAVFFRQEMPQADDLIEEAKDIYCRVGAKYRSLQRMFEFPTGSRVRFRPLLTDKDARKYQGQNITDAAIEEAGNYPSPKPILKIFGSLRSKHGLPVQLMLSANPGGVGHVWIKNLFIDPAPLGMASLKLKLKNGKIIPYIYIPSKVSDNKILLANDPGYVDRLHLVGSEALVRAWLEGDWSVIEGAFFSQFSIPRHVVPPFEVPTRWRRYIGYDHGFDSKFCAVWIALSDGLDDQGREFKTPDGRHIPKGATVAYREYFGRQLSVVDIAKEINNRSRNEEIFLRVADPSIFSSEGADSIADVFQKAGVLWQRADNSRLAGWTQKRLRLKPSRDESVLPMHYYFSTLNYLITTTQSAPIDPAKAEDLDTASDDHGQDGERYALMEIPLDAARIGDTASTSSVINAASTAKSQVDVGELLKKNREDRNKVKI